MDSPAQLKSPGVQPVSVLDSATNELEGLVSALEARLDSVTTPGSPLANSNGTATDKTTMTSRINMVNNRIRFLLDYLEV